MKFNIWGRVCDRVLLVIADVIPPSAENGWGPGLPEMIRQFKNWPGYGIEWGDMGETDLIKQVGTDKARQYATLKDAMMRLGWTPVASAPAIVQVESKADVSRAGVALAASISLKAGGAMTSTEGAEAYKKMFSDVQEDSTPSEINSFQADMAWMDLQERAVLHFVKSSDPLVAEYEKRQVEICLDKTYAFQWKGYWQRQRCDGFAGEVKWDGINPILAENRWHWFSPMNFWDGYDTCAVHLRVLPPKLVEKTAVEAVSSAVA